MRKFSPGPLDVEWIQVKEGLLKKLEAAETAAQNFHAPEIFERIQGLKALVQTPGYQGLISPISIRTIEKYSDLESEADLLDSSGAFSHNPSLSTLFQEVSKASKLENTLDSLMQILPSARSGDIWLEDERLRRDYQGEGGTVFSQISLFKTPSAAVDLAKGLIDPFRVQPYFTGSRSHAGMIEENMGVIQQVEVVKELKREEVKFSQALINVQWCPNFLAQLARVEGDNIDPKVRSSLTVIFGDLPDEQQQENILKVYAQCLQTYLRENEGRLELLRNDAARATNAYLLKATEFLPKMGQSVITGLTGTILGVTRRLGSKIFRPRTEEEVSLENKTFCSEFVTIVRNK
jgi:hypothetical protein